MIKNKNGFTLIELMIVVAIIGIIAAFILGPRTDDLIQIQTAQEKNSTQVVRQKDTPNATTNVAEVEIVHMDNAELKQVFQYSADAYVKKLFNNDYMTPNYVCDYGNLHFVTCGCYYEKVYITFGCQLNSDFKYDCVPIVNK